MTFTSQLMYFSKLLDMSESETLEQGFNWKKELKEIFLISLIGIPSGIVGCPSCMDDVNEALASIGLSALLWVILWKGNSYTSDIVDRYYDWLEKPITRLVVGVLAHTIYTSLIVLLLIFVIENLFDINVGGIMGTIIRAVIVTLIVSLIMHSKSFLTSWREVAINSEKMKKEAMVAKYESLKNQVNPHFLFNSLNALTNLVYEDQDLAAKFIKKLSEVYRYVLESRDKELVKLEDELNFVKSYVFLQKIRHENGLEVSYHVENAQQLDIVPLALQMLLENAIKHNIVSEEEPLKVEIKVMDNQLVVSNNLQRKNISQIQHVGVGLENIKARYQFLTESPVTIEETKSTFTITLPLLNLSQA